MNKAYDFSKSALLNEHGLLDCHFPLNPQSALAAHEQGAFAWYSEPESVQWWRPKQRAIFLSEQLHISRSTLRDLRRGVKAGRLRLSYDEDFAGVIDGCFREHEADGVWLLPEMRAVYQALHEQGVAHSVEVWEDDKLVGGVYGVALARVFCAESMFHRRSNASKIALWALSKALCAQQIWVLEAQMMTAHLHSLGAMMIRNADYQQLLALDNPHKALGSWRGLWRLEDFL